MLVQLLRVSQTLIFLFSNAKECGKGEAEKEAEFSRNDSFSSRKFFANFFCFFFFCLRLKFEVPDLTCARNKKRVQGTGRLSTRDKDNRGERMLVAAMRKLCRVALAAVLATALCVLTLVDMPPQLPEPPTDPPPTPGMEPPGPRSIVAYSWARRLALDYRPSRECNNDINDSGLPFDGTPMESPSLLASSSFIASNTTGFTRTNSGSSGIVESDESKKWLETIPQRLFLYSAHLDIRVTGYPSVRVIGVKRESAPPLLTTGTLFCTIWHKDDDGRTRSFTVEALISDIWLDEWSGSGDGYTGILITCQLPTTNNLQSVYVGPQSCYENPSHSLLVRKPFDETLVRENNEIPAATIAPSRDRNQFTLCIKALDFDEDISEKLVAFIELNRILGADMIYIYVFNVHENVSRVLRMYEKSNVVRWFAFELPGVLPNDVAKRRELFAKDVWIKRRMELIPYNHCFYENLYSSEFVMPIDIDETIIPVRRKNWSQLLTDERIKLGRSFKDFASYAVRNVYFFPDLQTRVNPRNSAVGYVSSVDAESTAETSPCYLDTVRTAAVSPEGDSVKSFVSTKRALTVHNHYALTTLNPSTRRAYHLDPRDALKHHHRICDDRHLDCDLMMEDILIDKSALRYADELKARINIALAQLSTLR